DRNGGHMSATQPPHPIDELSAYLDGALAGAERSSVDAHLAGCASCRAELGRLQGALRALAMLPPAPEPSAEFRRSFSRRVENEATAGERVARLFRLPRWFFAGSAGVAAAAALAMVLVNVQTQRHLRRAHELDIAASLELFESFEVVESVGAVSNDEDAQVIAALDELEKQP